MVYIRSITIKGHKYYELVKCQRDEEGNPRQKHLEYLGKEKINLEDLEKFEKLQHHLKGEEKLLSEILHSMHKTKTGLLDKAKFLEKAKNNGISAPITLNFLNKFTDQKFFIKVPNSKQTQTNLSNEIISKIDSESEKKGFRKSEFEKVVRLIEVLKEIANDKILKEKLCFFGGTAINSIYKDYPRLSVDIDLQYVGSSDKDVMLEDRKIIKEKIIKICKKLNYEFEEKNPFAINQFMIKYTMTNGQNEKTKLEINYLDRCTILPLKKAIVKTLIDKTTFSINTLEMEELYARKITALLDRTAIRDIYDVATMTGYDYIKLKKCVIANLLLRKNNLNLLNEKLPKPTQKEFENKLKPLLRKEENLSIDELHNKASNLVSEIKKTITKEELEYVKKFNRNNPEFEKLFEKIKINDTINNSPILKLTNRDL